MTRLEPDQDTTEVHLLARTAGADEGHGSVYGWIGAHNGGRLLLELIHRIEGNVLSRLRKSEQLSDILAGKKAFRHRVEQVTGEDRDGDKDRHASPREGQ